MLVPGTGTRNTRRRRVTGVERVQATSVRRHRLRACGSAHRLLQLVLVAADGVRLHGRTRTGEIEARDARVPGPGNGALRFFYHNPELGPQFIRRLFSEMDITLFRDFRQGPDWLAGGKFAVCFFCSDIPKARRQGLPVDSFGAMKEGAGIVSQYGTMGFPSNAPHPNAAKVFINWFLSREGQLTLQRALAKASDEAPDSLRIDISKDDVPAENKRVEGVKYLDLDVQGRLDMKPILDVIEEALAANKK